MEKIYQQSKAEFELTKENREFVQSSQNEYEF